MLYLKSVNIMHNVISINEIRIKSALKEAELALSRARTLVSEGEEVPSDIIPRLEEIVVNLEEQLIKLVEDDS